MGDQLIFRYVCLEISPTEFSEAHAEVRLLRIAALVCYQLKEYISTFYFV